MVIRILILFLFSFQINDSALIPGTFLGYRGGNQRLILEKDKFNLKVYTCTYKFGVKGAWHLKKDTLILEGKKLYKINSRGNAKLERGRDPNLYSRFKFHNHYLVLGNDSIVNLYISKSGKYYRGGKLFRIHSK